jgi:pimeloyl-ACP methyl ester carboxylesterase
LYDDQRQEKENLLNYLRMNESDMKSKDYTYDGPTTIIWGKEDKIIPLANAYLLQANYPNSILTILPGVGHVANMEGPEEVANCIRLLADTAIKQ